MPKEAPALPAALRAKVDEFVLNQREVDELEPKLKDAQARNRALRFELYEMLTNAGLSSVKTDSLGTFIKSSKGPYASVVDRDKAEEWAREQGLFEVLFKFMPVMPRISSLVRDALRGDTETPLPDKTVIDWHLEKTITWRRPEALAKAEE